MPMIEHQTLYDWAMFPVEDGRVCLFYIGMRKHVAVLEKDLGIPRPLSFFAPSSSILPSHARVTV